MSQLVGIPETRRILRGLTHFRSARIILDFRTSSFRGLRLGGGLGLGLGKGSLVFQIYMISVQKIVHCTKICHTKTRRISTEMYKNHRIILLRNIFFRTRLREDHVGMGDKSFFF